jgi:hypothetical protein
MTLNLEPLVAPSGVLVCGTAGWTVVRLLAPQVQIPTSYAPGTGFKGWLYQAEVVDEPSGWP